MGKVSVAAAARRRGGCGAARRGAPERLRLIPKFVVRNWSSLEKQGVGGQVRANTRARRRLCLLGADQILLDDDTQFTRVAAITGAPRAASDDAGVSETREKLITITHSWQVRPRRAARPRAALAPRRGRAARPEPTRADPSRPEHRSYLNIMICKWR